MTPEEVSFQMIRDWRWRQVRCDVCDQTVPFFHEHLTKKRRKDGTIESKPVRAKP